MLMSRRIGSAYSFQDLMKMSEILDITGDDIANLNDADLRTLIGRLCEADYQSAGISTKGILWGGNQDAKDGGIDVSVETEVMLPTDGFIPRKKTGFQVKKPDMQPAAIKKEMRPKGVLREEIKSLIQEKGAYIIVSSNGSTTKPALSSRVKAMKDAIATEENHQELHVDFLDRGQVATWVRNHPSLILWVRNKIGRHLNGWRPFENWSNPAAGIEEEYLLDDGLRLHDGSISNNSGFPVGDGLTRLRYKLGTPGHSIRLVGLSGVGKTRLVQALFDNRIGNQTLNPNQVFYTDMSDGPEPDPRAFAELLLAAKTRAILIVDNCPPDLHRRLTQTCSIPQSTISLLTIEYDVREEDVPEETSVFRLEPASEEIIEKLIQKRFSFISQVNARTIAIFSGGNARVAIALSNTVKKGETLSVLKDRDLFERLFWQKGLVNEDLLKAAKVCSLVYSFEGEDVESIDSELNILASLIGTSGAKIYENVTELKRRDLVQSRHVWRAVLPHAIANKLAKDALESIPKSIIKNTFLSSSERLIKSFSRRLNYLHDCKEAVEIVDEWLSEDGWIGKHVGSFNGLGLQVFKNIAPVSPEMTLKAIERAANGVGGDKFTSRDNIHFNDYVRLLRHLAYEPALFERSVLLMCRFAIKESPQENQDSIRQTLKSLFYIHLSGTHAPIEMRAKVIKYLLDDANEDKQALGLYLLDAALEAWHFGSHYEFVFGARPRDYGSQPKNLEERNHWYETAINICKRLALSNNALSKHARKLLADRLRGLWTHTGMFKTIEDAAKLIHENQAWNDGWIAILSIIRYDSKDFEKDELEKLHRLEKLLNPQDLLEQIRAYALSSQHSSFELDDNDDDISIAEERVIKITTEIGSKVAKDSIIFDIILPELVSTDCQRIYNFGIGLAEGCTDKMKLWKSLRTQFDKTIDEKKSIHIFLGFLFVCAEIDPIFYQSTLDDLITDPILGKWFPYFQNVVTIDKRGLIRLHTALDAGIVSIYSFRCIAYGKSHEALDDDELAELLEKILTKENGIDVAIEILKMRFHGSSPNAEYSSYLLKAGRKVMTDFEFPKGTGSHIHSLDHSMSKIAQICLATENGKEAAKAVCEHLKLAFGPYRTFNNNYPKLLKEIASVQPTIFMDVFLGNPESDDFHLWRGFDDRTNPLSAISDDDILAWCDLNPKSRYPLIISHIEVYLVSEDSNLTWKPIVHAIFKKAQDLAAILAQFERIIRPSFWSGSLAHILEKRSNLFKELFGHEVALIDSWAKQQFTYWQREVAKAGEYEKEEDRERNESFE